MAVCDVYTPSGSCCYAQGSFSPGTLDACGVCNGDGSTCGLLMSLLLATEQDPSLIDDLRNSSSPEYLAFVDNFTSDFAAALSLNTSRSVPRNPPLPWSCSQPPAGSSTFW